MVYGLPYFRVNHSLLLEVVSVLIRGDVRSKIQMEDITNTMQELVREKMKTLSLCVKTTIFIHHLNVGTPCLVYLVFGAHQDLRDDTAFPSSSCPQM